MRVADPAGDDGGGDRSDAGGGGDDGGGVGLGVEVRDAFVEVVDLLGQDLGLLGLDRDIGGELGEVDPGVGVGSPQFEGLFRGGEQCPGVVVAPGAARVPDQEPGQPSLSEPDQAGGVGVAGQYRQSGFAVVRAERVVPGRAEQLELGVEALEHRGTAFHDRGPDLHDPAQRFGRPVTGVLAQPFGVQQRQPGQQLGVQVVVLGVLGVVRPQIRRLSGRHHRDLRTPAPQPRRHRHPRVPGGLHHHRHRVALGEPEVVPQTLQVVGPGEELPPGPHECPVRTSQRRLMRSPARQIDTQRQPHERPFRHSQQGSLGPIRRRHSPDIPQAEVRRPAAAPSSRTGTPAEHRPAPRTTTQIQGIAKRSCRCFGRPRGTHIT